MDPLLEKKAERARARSSRRPAEEEQAESGEGRMQEFLLDMTAEAEAGRYHHVIGRDEEIEEIYNQGFEACQSSLYDQAIEKFKQVLAYPHYSSG